MLSPSSPRADIIRKLRQSGHHRVAVPWIVLEEMAAHQAKLYPVKYEAVTNTLDKLRALLPWELKSTLEPLDLERLMNHWRGVYGEIFEVIETSPEVARRALTREALALKPAKRAKDHSEGARDVAIWFSIIEFLKANPDETVHFVTDNTTDFGDGITYPYPMNEDIEGLENRLTRLTDFNEVVSAFTKTVSGADAEAVADELLRSPGVRARVAQTAAELLTSPSGFAGLGTDDTVVQWRGWWTAPEVELVTVTEVTGHEIEGDVWYTANARWLLYGLSFDEDIADTRYTACTWETKVLFSARDGSVVKQMGLADLSGLNRGIAEIALQHHLNLGDSLRRSLASLVPKLDVAGLMPHTDFSALIASSAARGIATRDSDDEEAEVADNQLSFEDAAATEDPETGDGTDPEPREDGDS
ncbi:PIN domain-containing protein [Streptomyces sp. NPDC047023]|uniref:PIN domain-containing protein n=1 Tax=Streptomyces sp. NPDC047023 TaxID=3155139 RepID=UPI0033C1A03F